MEIRAPSSPVLHKRFYSRHVEIGAARLERSAMISAALCNASSQQMFDHTWGVRDTETPFCQLPGEFLRARQSAQEQKERGVCT